MTYRIQLEDLLANAFIEKLKLDDSDRFISYKEIDHYSEEMIKSIHEKGENVELYLSRYITNNVLKKYCNYFRETADGIILKSDVTIDDLINNFRGYLSLFLMKEYISVYNKIKGELNMQTVKETKLWIIEEINLNSENEIYCICNDYDIFKFEMQKICDEDADYIFDNDCIISPRGIKYKGFCTKYIECVQKSEQTIEQLNKDVIENEEQNENNKLKKNTWYNDRLNEAKEIIEDLLDTQYALDPYLDIYKDRVIRAEKFIKFVKGE